MFDCSSAPNRRGRTTPTSPQYWCRQIFSGPVTAVVESGVSSVLVAPLAYRPVVSGTDDVALSVGLRCRVEAGQLLTVIVEAILTVRYWASRHNAVLSLCPRRQSR
jgi:hypothetical protein